jgi:di- and tripeptidase
MARVINTVGSGRNDAKHDDTDDSDIGFNGTRAAAGQLQNGKIASTPTLFHKVHDHKSILALQVLDGKVFAGTQGGEILVWSLDTYESVGRIKAHRGAVLGLYISPDEELLFSSGGDAIVNVWNVKDLSRVYSIYSTYDVGDVFCLVYSRELQTVYMGAQNTSIQVERVIAS